MRKDPQNKVLYDKELDILWFLIKSGSEYGYKEITPGIGVELGENGELLGIEILNASRIIKPLIDQKISATNVP